eukprot:GHUV01009633.1.p1 GENE.GHUV01009633.1~~GHUV01009633.1.p1  ORF type:complete len:221 (+),score=49.24 GHUV01009633.1:39-665(+)
MENNRAPTGGAIRLYDNATAVIKGGALIKNNSADFGGGLSGGSLSALRQSKVILERCMFVDNHATVGGGAIDLAYNAIVVIKGGALIKNNSAEYGGGLSASQSKVILERCMFEDNHATVGGGALYVGDPSILHIRPRVVPFAGSAGSAPDIYDTVITNNTANYGGGLYTSGTDSFDPSALLAISHGNKAPYDTDIYVPLRKIEAESHV